MDIERLATAAIKERISFCKGLSPFIADGDKEPSWDGHIYVYPNDEKKKSELIDRIPVQVKGKKKVVKESAMTISFGAEVSDLTNYDNAGGVIYFVVIIGDNRSKQIFYKCLLPFDLHCILRDVEIGDTKSITLRRMPDDDESIMQIFLSFIADKKRQATQIIWSEEQAVAAVKEGASFQFHIQPKTAINNQFEMLQEVTTQPFYLYVLTKDGVEFPYAKVEEDYPKMTRQSIDKPVYIGDVKYYDEFCYGYENGKAYLYIGRALRIPIVEATVEENSSSKKTNFTYSLTGSLSERITDSDFLLALSQYKIIRVGNAMMPEINMNNHAEVLRLRERNSDLKRIKSAFDFFGVKDDLDMNNLVITDYQNINDIVLAAEGNEITYKESNLQNLFYVNKKIGNVLIRVLSRKDEDDGGYRLFNAFIDEAHVKLVLSTHDSDRKTIEPWSLFIHMRAADFLCSNINYDMILNSLRKMKPEDLEFIILTSETQSISANNMLLEIVRAYDSQSTKNEELLRFAEKVADILLSNDPVSIVNKLQIVKRQRPLSNDEISDLVILRNKRKQKKYIKCAIAILLDETEDAKRLLDELPEKERKAITDYPLYSLIKS